MTLPTCKTCRYFNFKVSAAHSWGECLNPVVQDAQWISYLPGNRPALKALLHLWDEDVITALLKDVHEYARVYYREDEFGCRFHEAEEVHP